MNQQKIIMWLAAALIAVVFFVGGFFAGQAHSRSAMRGMYQGGAFQHQGYGMGSGTASSTMHRGMQGMNGMASGTPMQMPAQAGQGQ